MAKNKGLTEVSIYPDWCKGCGICVAFCPGKVLELGPDGKARAVNGKECSNCGFCEYHCPDFAIVVKTKKTPKAYANQDKQGQKGQSQE
jgi:2-oxoglutarate ferredoxin oxidoreductase subunit delta